MGLAKKSSENKIEIKKENQGDFTQWCKNQGFNGVTNKCISKSKEYCQDGDNKRKSKRICKMGTFAKNAKSWN